MTTQFSLNLIADITEMWSFPFMVNAFRAATLVAVLAAGVGVLPFLAAMWIGEAIWLSFAVLGLAVIAETFQLLFAIVKYLGVAYLLEGSVQRSEGRLRVIAHLIEERYAGAVDRVGLSMPYDATRRLPCGDCGGMA